MAIHHASRKKQYKFIRSILSTATVEEITIETKYQSEFIHYLIDICGNHHNSNFHIGRVEFKLVNYQSVATEKYGDLGIVSIELYWGFDYFALGIPNKAFCPDQTGHLHTIVKWDAHSVDNFLYTVFEDNTIADFVKKVLAKLKERYKEADGERKKTLLKYPPKANVHALEAKKIEYEISTVNALLETITCISKCYTTKKPK